MRGWRLALIVATAALACSPGRAAAPSPLTELRRELDNVRDFLQNAQVRLRRGVQQGIGSGPRQADPARAPAAATPAQACCGDNVDHIRGSLEKMKGDAVRLGACHTGQGNAEAGKALERLQQDLDEMLKGVKIFESAEKVSQTQAALGGLNRLYHVVREGLDHTAECSPR
ncbi:MAG TPA: hypothetical protein VJS92_01300 [Candidatus Polarisedimenticolaceae bacterium]|nr:hypothetical protein [Candidatus Polarisedimenticolaceae bacterium]